MNQRTVHLVPTDRLFVSPQVRTEWQADSLTELAVNIRQVGILQPIHVRPAVDGRHEIVFGARRWMAAQLAELPQVPVLIDSRPLTPATVVQMQFVENVAREDLPPLDKARGIAEFMRLSECNASEAASSLGICCATVSNHLALLKLPVALQDQIRSGALPATIGVELSRVPDAKQQLALAQQWMAGALRPEALRREVKAAKTQRPEPAAQPIQRATAPLSGGGTVTVAGKSLNLDRFIAALEEALAKARRVRGRGVELSTFVRLLRDEAKAQEGKV